MLELRTDPRTVWIWRIIFAIALVGSLAIAVSLLAQRGSADQSQTVVVLAVVTLAIIVMPPLARGLSKGDEMELIAQVRQALANGPSPD